MYRETLDKSGNRAYTVVSRFYRRVLGFMKSEGKAMPINQFQVYPDTNIPTCGNQTIRDLARRTVAYCQSPFEAIDEDAVRKVTDGLMNVYLAGYQAATTIVAEGEK